MQIIQKNIKHTIQRTKMKETNNMYVCIKYTIYTWNNKNNNKREVNFWWIMTNELLIKCCLYY